MENYQNYSLCSIESEIYGVAVHGLDIILFPN